MGKLYRYDSTYKGRVQERVLGANVYHDDGCANVGAGRAGPYPGLVSTSTFGVDTNIRIGVGCADDSLELDPC